MPLAPESQHKRADAGAPTTHHFHHPHPPFALVPGSVPPGHQRPAAPPCPCPPPPLPPLPRRCCAAALPAPPARCLTSWLWCCVRAAPPSCCSWRCWPPRTRRASGQRRSACSSGCSRWGNGACASCVRARVCVMERGCRGHLCVCRCSSVPFVQPCSRLLVGRQGVRISQLGHSAESWSFQCKSASSCLSSPSAPPPHTHPPAPPPPGRPSCPSSHAGVPHSGGAVPLGRPVPHHV